MQPSQIIHIHVHAPAKPEEGAPCNGCGVCCLTQPCPLGMVLSGARTGACKALRWQDSVARYVCGAVDEPYAVVRSRMPSAIPWLVKPLAAALPALARRWIAVGVGCDSSLQPLTPLEPPLSDNPLDVSILLIPSTTDT